LLRFVMVSVGPAYGMEYVSTLADMIARNASQVEQFSIECVTDRPDELPPGVGYVPARAELPGWWQKVGLFAPDLPWEVGDKIIYFDLDVAITGRLEDLVEAEGIIQDWNWPCFNSSVMAWTHGEHENIWRRFDVAMIDKPGKVVPAELLPAGQINGGDQEWITEVGGWKTFPAEWFVSYRAAKAWPPNGCKAVILHGKPKPHEVTAGWVPNVWKVGGFTSLPLMNGVNVTHDHLAENIRAAVKRDLPWFTGFKEGKRRAVIVGGAPSMLDHLADIRAHKRDGASIISVNNAWRVLVDAGITPDNHIMLDARAENAAFLEGAPAKTRYLIASQCHPDVFDALEGKDVILWHNGFGDNKVLHEVLAPWWGEGPNQRPCILVPGGGTVGLRALWLCFFAGFRSIHCYGMDSSYDGDKHHAYDQPINDADRVMEVVLHDPATGNEKRYSAARWMVRQVSEFRETYADLKREGVRIFVHGRGLLPDVVRGIRAEEAQ